MKYVVIAVKWNGFEVKEYEVIMFTDERYSADRYLHSASARSYIDDGYSIVIYEDAKKEYDRFMEM